MTMSPVFLLTLSNWSLFFWLTSPISCFLQAAQPFSTNTLSSLYIASLEMFLLSRLSISLSSAVDLSDLQSGSFMIYPGFNNALDS